MRCPPQVFGPLSRCQHAVDNGSTRRPLFQDLHPFHGDAPGSAELVEELGGKLVRGRDVPCGPGPGPPIFNLETVIEEAEQRDLLLFPASPAKPQVVPVFLSLTAMRGVAALLVAFFHLRFGISGVPLFDYYVFSFRFGNKGYLWVDFFFILSGFILTYRYRDVCRRLRLRVYADFIWHRFARIWPLHLVTLVGAVLYRGYKNGIAYLSPKRRHRQFASGPWMGALSPTAAEFSVVVIK